MDAARVKVKTQCDCSIIFVSKIWTLTVESELNRVHATGQMLLTIQISLARSKKNSSCNIFFRQNIVHSNLDFRPVQTECAMHLNA